MYKFSLVLEHKIIRPLWGLGKLGNLKTLLG